MSQWTHVAGLIRLDSFGSPIVRLPVEEKNEKIKEAVAKALGKTCDFDSGPEICEECSVPSGSEGGIHYRVFPNSDKDDHALSWGYVAIWGDLRDFGAEELTTIKEWFQKSIERLKKPEGHKAPEDMSAFEKADYFLSTFGIRDAVLSIDVEFSGKKLLLTVNDDDQVIQRELKIK